MVLPFAELCIAVVRDPRFDSQAPHFSSLSFSLQVRSISERPRVADLQPKPVGRFHPGYWASIDNQKKFFHELEEKFSIRSPSDWYAVTTRQVISEGGASLLGNYYNWSLLSALEAIYPEHTWKSDAAEAHKSATFWKNTDNLRLLFEDVAKKLKIASLEGWYAINRAKLVEARSDAKSALRYFSGSFVDALQVLYPEHEWLPWRFPKVKAGYWDDAAAQRAFFDWCAIQLQIQSFEDWYAIGGKQVEKMGGKYLLEHYHRHSLATALRAVYPEHSWNDSKFIFRSKTFWETSQSSRSPEDASTGTSASKPSGWWSDPQNLQQIIQTICHAKGISQTETPSDELYSVTSEDIIKAGGGSALRHHFASSPVKLLKCVFPSHNWLEWKFLTLPRGWWSIPTNQRQFLDWAAVNEFKFDPKDSPESWYDISARDIASKGGSRLVTIHGGSPHRVLSTAYPEHRWRSWKFKQVPPGFWENVDADTLRDYLDDAASKLGFRHPADWEHVSWAQLQKLGAAHVFVRLGGIKEVVTKAYGHASGFGASSPALGSH